MGSRLVAEVSVKFADVGYDAFRVLVHMACHSLDTENGNQKARRYFGGQEVLARAMRPHLPSEEDPSPEARKAWKNALRDLREAMEILVVCGAVTRTVARPKPGDRQEWHLSLIRRAEPVSPRQQRRKERMAALRQKRMQGEVPPPAQGTVPPPNAGGSSPSGAGDSSPSPGTTEEPREDKQQEPDSSRECSTTGPRGRATPKSESHGRMDPETAGHVRDASRSLLAALGAEGTERATAAAFAELGPDATTPEAVIYAAQRFAANARRTG